MKNRRRGISAWAVVVGSIIFCLAAYFVVRWQTRGPESETKQEVQPAVTVGVETLKSESLRRIREMTGSIKAKNPIAVSAESNGLRVSDILVEEGDSVASGQVLARLDSSSLAARRRQLEARLQQQRASLSKTVSPNRPLETAQLRSSLEEALTQITVEKANLQVAQAALQDAAANLERYQALYKSGAIPKTEAESRRLEYLRQKGNVEVAEDRVTAARAGARQAEQRLQLANQGGRTEDVTIAQAQIDELQGQLEELQIQIDQATIRAPRAGLVSRKNVELGQVVTPGTVLFEMVQNGELELRATVPATDIGQIEIGQAATVTSGSLKAEGRVWKISPQVDEETRNAEVRIELPNSSGFRPGMFADARIPLEFPPAPLAPQKAIFGESPDYYVFLLQEDQTVEKASVSLGPKSEGKVAIVKGVRPGQKLVVEGGGFLRDGDKVALP